MAPKAGMGSLHGVEPKGKPHFDYQWFFNKDVGLRALNGGESGCNLLVCPYKHECFCELSMDSIRHKIQLLIKRIILNCQLMKKFEILLRHFLLNLLLFFTSSKSNKTLVRLNQNSKVLLIRLNRIGDALVTTPLIKELKEQKNCKVIVLADSKNHFIFRNKFVDEVWVFSKGFKGFFEILSKINNSNFDVIADLHDDVSTTVTYLLALCKAVNKIGLSKYNKKVYTHSVERLDAAKIHVIDRNLALASLLDLTINKDEVNVFYCPLDESKKKAEDFISSNFDNKFLVGINISAGNISRFWGIENYKRLVETLSGRNVNVLLLCSPSDSSLAEEIASDKVKVFYSGSFDEFSAIIGRLNLLFTPDTSVVHIASAFRIPVFGLYVNYNTTEMIWTPYKSDFDCIITKEPTLENIKFEDVINKLIPFLEKHNI
jgi:ADP-heptose:LPS heptosyltransferase